MLHELDKWLERRPLWLASLVLTTLWTLGFSTAMAAMLGLIIVGFQLIGGPIGALFVLFIVAWAILFFALWASN